MRLLIIRAIGRVLSILLLGAAVQIVDKQLRRL
jgi:hypothetical protein